MLCYTYIKTQNPFLPCAQSLKQSLSLLPHPQDLWASSATCHRRLLVTIVTVGVRDFRWGLPSLRGWASSIGMTSLQGACLLVFSFLWAFASFFFSINAFMSLGLCKLVFFPHKLVQFQTNQTSLIILHCFVIWYQ